MHTHTQTHTRTDAHAHTHTGNVWMNGWLLAPPLAAEISLFLPLDLNLIFCHWLEFLRHPLTFVILTTGKMWRHQSMLSFILWEFYCFHTYTHLNLNGPLRSSYISDPTPYKYILYIFDRRFCRHFVLNTSGNTCGVALRKYTGKTRHFTFLYYDLKISQEVNTWIIPLILNNDAITLTLWRRSDCNPVKMGS